MNSAIPPFATIDDALEEFESAWDSGQPPDLALFVSKLKPQHRRRAVPEMIEIDIERRWRSVPRVAARPVVQYQKLFSYQLSDSDWITLVCSDYQVRNRWGDCKTRPEIYRQYEHLGKPLLRGLRKASAQICWPEIAVTDNGTVTMKTLLDRLVEVGRQQPDEKSPWIVRSNFVRHRLVLNEFCDQEISRNQLSLSLASPDAVLVQNLSTSRHVTIRNKGPLHPGERFRLRMPFMIQLGPARYLRVTAAEEQDSD